VGVNRKPGKTKIFSRCFAFFLFPSAQHPRTAVRQDSAVTPAGREARAIRIKGKERNLRSRLISAWMASSKGKFVSLVGLSRLAQMLVSARENRGP